MKVVALDPSLLMMAIALRDSSVQPNKERPSGDQVNS
jgi:hypothetical protein